MFFAIIKSRNISRDTIARDSEYTHKTHWHGYGIAMPVLFLSLLTKGVRAMNIQMQNETQSETKNIKVRCSHFDAT